MTKFDINNNDTYSSDLSIGSGFSFKPLNYAIVNELALLEVTSCALETSERYDTSKYCNLKPLAQTAFPFFGLLVVSDYLSDKTSAEQPVSAKLLYHFFIC